MGYETELAAAAAGMILMLAIAFLWMKRQISAMGADCERRLLQQKNRLEAEYSARVVDKQAELTALQSQINPHFLYNTLECIRSEALFHDCDSIARMAKALASFFRYGISRKEDIVTIRDELHNIENYFLIQSYRFDDKFSYEIQVGQEDQEAYSYLIPKMTLQPIVENAIFHGLESRAMGGKVTIRVEATDRHVILVVSDNGVGIGREKLEEMRTALKGARQGKIPSSGQGNGIALANVSQRLRLVFGEDYGLNLFSTVGIGTDVELVLPVVTDRARL